MFDSPEASQQVLQTSWGEMIQRRESQEAGSPDSRHFGNDRAPVKVLIFEDMSGWGSQETIQEESNLERSLGDCVILIQVLTTNKSLLPE